MRPESRQSWTVSRRVLVGGAAAAAACLVVFLVLHDTGPSVPHDKHPSMTFSPTHVRPGSSVSITYDHVVGSQLDDTLLLSRWDDGEWGETHLLASGTWTPLTGGSQLAMVQPLAQHGTTSGVFFVAREVAVGDYLVCDMDDNCGLLKVT